MRREEKNALSRRRILEAAMREFSAKGYEGASLNTVCGENNISKGIIYHYFQDKDELYLLCVAHCFERLTRHLKEAQEQAAGSVEKRLDAYFDARLRFFAENPLDLGIFISATLDPPDKLRERIRALRGDFDRLNIAVLTGLLESVPLRPGITVSAVVEDFRMYMDYFNLRFRGVPIEACAAREALHRHEEQAHRQLDILLYGVLEAGNGGQ